MPCIRAFSADVRATNGNGLIFGDRICNSSDTTSTAKTCWVQETVKTLPNIIHDPLIFDSNKFCHQEQINIMNEL